MTGLDGAHRRAFWLCAFLAIASLTGCGAPPTYKNRPVSGASPGTFALAHAKAVEEPRHAMRHLDEARSVVYTQSAGGGGVAVGLLFGPLGAAANAGMIDNRTELDAQRLKGKLTLEPRQLFLDAAIRQGLDVASAGAAGQTGATPYLHISKASNERLLTAVAVRLEQGTGADQWTGLYLYQLPLSYSLDDLARPTEEIQRQLSTEAARGFSELAAFMAKEGQPKDGPGKTAPEKEFTYVSDLLTPRFEIQMRGRFIARSEDLVWFRTFDGIYAVRASNIKIKSGRI